MGARRRRRREMATWYVAPGGKAPPDGNGSVDKPWSLEHALGGHAAIMPGDRVLLRGGIYANLDGYQVRVAGAPGARVQFAAHPGEAPLIDGTLPAFWQVAEPAWEPWPAPEGQNV